MIKLHAYCDRKWNADPFVARVTTNSELPIPLRSREALLLQRDSYVTPKGFRIYLCSSQSDSAIEKSKREEPVQLQLPKELEYLGEGDIIRINPRAGGVSVLYRCKSSSNTILLTEQCNCNCIMCPQPPKKEKDEFWSQVWLEAIALMSPTTSQLGISGGEPTMVPDNMLNIIRACKNFLPQTSLHVLSNGRLFNYMSLCQKVASIKHPNLVFGIPIYSDLAYLHDFIVQRQGAFDQTIRGIMNLKRCDQHIEIRTVLLRQNIQRLPSLASFIARNLAFVEHVAIMGLEPIGYAKSNIEELWVDPVDYQLLLKEAVEELSTHHITVSIYNHQLCVLEQSLWQFARKSISDWKNEYLEICNTCSLRQECGGFFSSSKFCYSQQIHPI